eukprot:jgi/Botrbrau1/10876/Bobra.0025s0053.1
MTVAAGRTWRDRQAPVSLAEAPRCYRDVLVLLVLCGILTRSALGQDTLTAGGSTLGLVTATPESSPILYDGMPPEASARDAAAEDCLVPIQVPTSTWCGLNAASPDTINLQDNGDGTAIFTARFSNGATLSGAPTILLYGKSCSLLFGSLTITMKRTTLAPYVPANINTWLAGLGLANLQVISGSLTIFMDQLPYNIPPQQSPIFLSSLQQVGLLTIAECLNCAASPGLNPTNASALVFLQGLRNLQKFYNLAQNSAFVTALSVTGTAFINMGSLVGLKCAPGSLTIRNNREMLSLTGLESLNTTLRPGPAVTISNNGLLSSSSVAALRPLAGCPAAGVGPVLSSNNILIATVQCNARCWTSYCSYANGLGCGICTGISSPPPPPPITTASCTPRPLTPACGALADFISVRDTGDGLCVVFGSINGANFVRDCSAPLFGQVCDRLLPQMVLTYVRATTGAYRPQMARWLSQLGLGSLTVMARPLTIIVDHTPNPITTPLNPFFLGSLLQVGALVVYECANCANSVSIGPATPALQSLPGLVKIDRFRDFSQPPSTLGSLILRNTAFQNMLSFSGIRCTPGQYSIVGNRALTSLAGFDGVGYGYFAPGPFASVVNNALSDPQSVASWRIMAGCGTSSPIIQNGLNLQVGSCNIVCWVAYCTFLQSGGCPVCPRPPPPARPPPPPPVRSPPPPPPPPPPPVRSPPPPPPPSPPPPPPIQPSGTCPLDIAKVAPVCGSTLQRMTLTFGANSCTGKFSGFPALDSSLTYTCTSANPFPGITCGTFLGDILITFDQDFPLGASTLAQTYLTQLGVGNIVWVQNLLLGRNFYWQNAGIRPTLLPQLQYVEGIFGVTTQVAILGNIIGGLSFSFAGTDPSGVLDTANMTGPSAVPNLSMGTGSSAGPDRRSIPGITVPLTGFGIEALPGQSALRAVGNLLILYGVSFTDLSPFSGLRCVGTYWLSDNPTITSLNGIQPIATAPPGGLVYDAFPAEYKQLVPQSLKLLTPIAKCSGTTSSNVEYINMAVLTEPPVQQPCVISTWSQICAFTGTTLPCFP